MTDDLEPQIRAWVEDINDPIPIDDVRLRQHRQASTTKRGPVVLAIAAVFLLIAGSVALLANSGDSSLETVADSDEAKTTTGPETTAPSAATTAPDESMTTTGPAPTTTPTTAGPATTTSTAPPPKAPRTGTVSDVADPPDGENCEGLRSRTVWATTGTPDEIAAAAGGRADYVETVTNEGSETCTMVFERCSGPGVLFTAEGEPVPRAPKACPAIAYAPADLAPGQSRQDVRTVELFSKPGDYELRVPQYDGRVATLPTRLEPQSSACGPGTLALDQEPYHVFVRGNDTTFAHLFIEAAQQSCTIRITDARLTLRPEGDPAAAERTFIDEGDRWYITGADATYAEAMFGPIDLGAGQYEGFIAVLLENGETLRKPARLLVG